MEYKNLDIKLPKLESWIFDYHKTRASRFTPSTMTAYMTNLLREEALRPQRRAYERMRKHQEEMKRKYPEGTGTDSVEIIRAIRDEKDD